MQAVNRLVSKVVGRLIGWTVRRAASGLLSNTARLVGWLIGRQEVGWLVR